MADGAPTQVETVTITVDGKSIEARKGEMVIAAAERGGVYIPRFCWHPRLRPVGMCRMCLVEVKGPRGFALVARLLRAGGRRPGGRHRLAQGQEGPGRRPRVPPDQPPPRLPGVRPGRRVPPPGPDLRLRPRREPDDRGEAALGEAHPDQPPGRPRPGAVHPVRPLHPLRRRGGGRRRHRLRGPGRRHRGQHLPRPSRSSRTSPATSSRSARWAPSPPPPTGSRPGRGTSTWWSPPAPSARWAAASRCSRRRTASPATWASTATPSTTAGCATRAASATRPSSPTPAWPPRWCGAPTAASPRRRGRWPCRRRPTACARSSTRPAPGRWPSSAAPAWPTRTPTPGPSWPRRVARHRQRRLPAGRRPARGGGARPAPGHHRRGLRGPRHPPPRARPQGGAAGPLPAAPGGDRRQGRAPGRAGRRPATGLTRHAAVSLKHRPGEAATVARALAGAIAGARISSEGAGGVSGGRHRQGRPTLLGTARAWSSSSAARRWPSRPRPRSTPPACWPRPCPAPASSPPCAGPTCTAPSTWASPPASSRDGCRSTTGRPGSPPTRRGARCPAPGASTPPPSSRPRSTTTSTPWSCWAPTRWPTSPTGAWPGGRSTRSPSPWPSTPSPTRRSGAPTWSCPRPASPSAPAPPPTSRAGSPAWARRSPPPAPPGPTG